jgi:hypothetical protein
MMRRAISLLAVFLAACGGGQTLEGESEPFPAVWTAEVQAQGEAGHSGFATITLLPGGQTRANTTLSGGSAGGVHPWAIHEGTCDSEGPIVGTADAYPVLTPNELGNASATATLDLTLASDASYALRIFESPEDRETVVGCGELRSSQ